MSSTRLNGSNDTSSTNDVRTMNPRPNQAPGSGGNWNGTRPPNTNYNASQYGGNDGQTYITPVATQQQYHVASTDAHTPYYGHQQHTATSQAFRPSVPPVNAYQTFLPTPQSQAPSNQFLNSAQNYYQPQSQSQSQSQSQAPAQYGQPYRPAGTNTSPQANADKQMSLSRHSRDGNTALCMALAEEFFDAAHLLAVSVSLSLSPESLDQYYKLIATGLGLLEATLKNPRLLPRTEAIIRLRYAGMLFEETNNTMEAETALSKGIALCDRNHYFDLKYAMQFLLARLIFVKSPRAAFRTLDSTIQDATTYQHHSWFYAFRFLQVSHSLTLGGPVDITAAISGLKSIADLAIRQNDRGVHFAASLMQAMAHLKFSGPEAMEGAQTAMGEVWQYQLDPSSKVPQLTGLAHIIDVVSSIRQGNSKVMQGKLRDMQTFMDLTLKNTDSWTQTNELFAIPVNRTASGTQVVSSDTRAVIDIGKDGREYLMMSFLNLKDAYSVTYLLCGVALMNNNPNTGKAMNLLEGGLRALDATVSHASTSPSLLLDTLSRLDWRGQLICYFSSYIAFLAASLGDWTKVKRYMDKFHVAMSRFNLSQEGFLGSVGLYLKGVYYQGIGKLDAALKIFQDPKFQISPPTESNSNGSTVQFSASEVERDFSLLAAFSSIWILQEPHRRDIEYNSEAVARLTSICENHADRDIQAAYHLVAATVKTKSPLGMIETKKHLSQALDRAQRRANLQFVCITLTVMCDSFFINVVGEQAEKSATAASVQAKKAKNELWQSVADGMLANCLKLNGHKEKSANVFEEAMEHARNALPSHF